MVVVKPETKTEEQPTNQPTRKMWAVILSAMLATGIEVILRNFVPELDDEVADELRVLVYGALISFAGYMTKEWKQYGSLHD
jgi:hypothetical protein